MVGVKRTFIRKDLKDHGRHMFTQSQISCHVLSQDIHRRSSTHCQPAHREVQFIATVASVLGLVFDPCANRGENNLLEGNGRSQQVGLPWKHLPAQLLDVNPPRCIVETVQPERSSRCKQRVGKDTQDNEGRGAPSVVFCPSSSKAAKDFLCYLLSREWQRRYAGSEE